MVGPIGLIVENYAMEDRMVDRLPYVATNQGLQRNFMVESLDLSGTYSKPFCMKLNWYERAPHGSHISRWPIDIDLIEVRQSRPSKRWQRKTCVSRRSGCLESKKLGKIPLALYILL